MAECRVRVLQGRFAVQNLILRPHRGTDYHETLELVPDMSMEELKQVGTAAVEQSLLFLCPEPTSPCNDDLHGNVIAEVYDLTKRWPVSQVAWIRRASSTFALWPFFQCIPSEADDEILDPSHRKPTEASVENRLLA